MGIELDPERVAGSPFVVGAAGALISLRFVPGKGFVERFGIVAAGTACAGYVTPALAEWFGLQSPAMHGALAFLIGMFGLSLAAAGMQAVRDPAFVETLKSWLPRRG